MLADKKPQTFDNHARFIPLFHFVAFGCLAVNALWRIYLALFAFSVTALVDLLVAIALLILLLATRAFVSRLQDRVIRLEMRLRLSELLPADLLPRVEELTVDQLVALRFADDAELPELTRHVLANGISDRKQIKQRIRSWKPDYLRV